MSLAAAQVVDSVVDRLLNVVATGSRVYTARPWLLAESDLPAWTVLAADETVERLTVHYPQAQLHELTIDAAVHARAASGIDDALHVLIEAGLQALFATEPPHRLRLDGISRRVDARDEAAISTHTLRLAATFTTSANAPQTITS